MHLTYRAWILAQRLVEKQNTEDEMDFWLAVAKAIFFKIKFHSAGFLPVIIRSAKFQGTYRFCGGQIFCISEGKRDYSFNCASIGSQPLISLEVAAVAASWLLDVVDKTAYGSNLEPGDYRSVTRMAYGPCQSSDSMKLLTAQLHQSVGTIVAGACWPPSSWHSAV